MDFFLLSGCMKRSDNEKKLLKRRTEKMTKECERKGKLWDDDTINSMHGMATHTHSHQSAPPSSVRACACVCAWALAIDIVHFSLVHSCSHSHSHTHTRTRTFAFTFAPYLRCSFSATILDYLDRVSDTSEIIIYTLLAFRYLHIPTSNSIFVMVLVLYLCSLSFYVFNEHNSVCVFGE